MSTKTSSRMSSTTTHANVSTPDYTLTCPDDVKQLSHHKQRNQSFHNPWPSFVDPGGPAIMYKIMKRNLLGQANKPDTTNPAIEVLKPIFRAQSATKEEHSTIRATWLGHASYLLEFPSTSSNLTVIFDPVYTKRCSPLTFAGPARYTPAPCQPLDLPPIDVVVISHNHYDHMSYPDLTAIYAANPNAHFFMPLNLKKWFLTNGIGKASTITEMDWWQSADFTLPGSSSATATFSCLPAQHATARTGPDRNTTLWCGWSITTPHSQPNPKSVYFVGDTGYRSIPEKLDIDRAFDQHNPALKELPVCPAFAQIGKLRGPFDLALIPIGAYAPRWLFSGLHGDPYDAVAICEDVKAKKALAMHWGTWVLTEEDVTEPRELLKEAVIEKGFEEGRFVSMAIGESREF
ncbi:unnamed protein product [Zymoseptoria tritici ST99CH_1A5]|nr:unnamed protein product [Zymoseptoria tritici ST99CH_3D1]SMY29696.1 unnamed protein product [Zymoseptoria tritici ST99CH_1A5]